MALLNFISVSALICTFTLSSFALHVTRWIHDSLSQIWDKLNSSIKLILEVDWMKVINWSLILFYHIQCLIKIKILTQINLACASAMGGIILSTKYCPKLLILPINFRSESPLLLFFPFGDLQLCNSVHVTRWIHNSMSQIWDKLNISIKWHLEVDWLKMINWSIMLFYHIQCL